MKAMGKPFAVLALLVASEASFVFGATLSLLAMSASAHAKQVCETSDLGAAGVVRSCYDDGVGAAPPSGGGVQPPDQSRQRAAAKRLRDAEWSSDEAAASAKRGDWDNAIRSLEEALENDPDNEDLEKQMALARAAKARAAADKARVVPAVAAPPAVNAKPIAPKTGVTPTVAAPPIDYKDSDAVAGLMKTYLRSNAWVPAETTRMEAAFAQLALPKNQKPVDSVARRMDAWTPLKARAADSGLIAAAQSGQGPGLYSSGWQSGKYSDCTLFALATAAGLPYGVVAARANELLRNASWRSPAQRQQPQKVFEQGGLMGGEVIMLTEAFGQVEIVPQSSFADTLKSGRPVMVRLTNPDGLSSHEVVLSKTFNRDGAVWYEMINSTANSANQRTFIRADEIAALIAEQGVAYRPSRRTTVNPLR